MKSSRTPRWQVVWISSTQSEFLGPQIFEESFDTVQVDGREVARVVILDLPLFSTLCTLSLSSNHPSHPAEPPKKKNHIKKPLNAFMLFMKEQRPKVIAECTLRESSAINQILGRRVSPQAPATPSSAKKHALRLGVSFFPPDPFSLLHGPHLGRKSSLV